MLELTTDFGDQFIEGLNLGIGAVALLVGFNQQPVHGVTDQIGNTSGPMPLAKLREPEELVLGDTKINQSASGFDDSQVNLQDTSCSVSQTMLTDLFDICQ